MTQQEKIEKNIPSVNTHIDNLVVNWEHGKYLQVAIWRKLGYHERIYLCNVDLATYNFC
jgi:hypothetical protein